MKFKIVPGNAPNLPPRADFGQKSALPRNQKPVFAVHKRPLHGLLLAEHTTDLVHYPLGADTGLHSALHIPDVRVFGCHISAAGKEGAGGTVRSWTHTHAHTHIYIYIYIYISHTHTHTHTLTHTHTHTHTLSHIHTHTHSHIHTHTHTPIKAGVEQRHAHTAVLQLLRQQATAHIGGCLAHVVAVVSPPRVLGGTPLHAAALR